MMNKHATSPLTAYTGRLRDMPPPSHRYNTRTQPKSNVSIQKTNSRQPNIHLKTYNEVINTVTGVAMEYRDLIKNPTTKTVWTRSMVNEFRRLEKGVGTRIKTGTETI